VPTVRRAETRDADAVLALVAGLGRPAVAEDAEPQRQVFLDHLAFDDAAVLVAEEDGSLTGIVSLWVRPRLNWTAPEAWISELYVAPEHRRQGIAGALVDACIHEARRRGCHRVVLESARNRDDAHAFYRAYGFKHSGRRYELPLVPPT
jgi:ribosomal protein S18 acetylase RimI-like enzyme